MTPSSFQNGFVLLLAAGWLGSCAMAAEQKLKPIEELRGFPNVEGLRVEAKTSGVITYAGVAGDELAIQDDTGAIWVIPPVDRKGPSVRPGTRVEIGGIVKRGNYAPDFVADSLRVLDEPGLPAARVATGNELLSGAYDCRFVEVTGVIRAVLPWTSPGDTRAMMHLDVNGVRVIVITPPGQLARLTPLADAVARVRGINTVAVNDNGQVLNTQVRVSEPEWIEILEPPRDVATLPLIPLGRLLGHPASGEPGHRVRTRGTVIGSRRGEVVQLQDDAHGVRVWTMNGGELPPLDAYVEVLGFPVPGPFSPQLEDGEFRILGKGDAPKPLELPSVRDALKHDGRLVTVTARLVEAQTDASPARLLLEDGNLLFAAEFADPVPGGSLPATPGAIVAITGIVEVSVGLNSQDAGYPKPRGLLLHLRQSGDIRVVHPAPWWTPLRLAAALAASVAALVTVIIFAGLLGRKNQRLVAAESELLTARDALAKRVETRTDQLQAQLTARRDEFAEYSAVTAERNRLARDLHDSLEQTLAGAALRMDAANDLLPTIHSADLNPARRQMEKAAELLRLSQGQVRRTVWGLRSLALEKRSLADALRESVRLLTEDTGIAATLDLHDGDTGLSPEQESELLHIAQEAVANVLKHSQATNLLITLHRDDDNVVLTVTDNGRGFDPTVVPVENGRPHYGQHDMRERAAMMGAVLSVKSEPAAGASVKVILRPVA